MLYQFHRRVLLTALVVCAAVAASACAVSAQGRPQAPSFARLVEEFSEPGGYFDTDNLISNEKSYLHVIPHLEQGGVTGGVYLGVGPDQNFSYIAAIRPSVAFILDIRRDNLLLHLLFKALFAEGRNRLEYLCLLTGRPVPEQLDSWRDASIERIVAYIDGTKPAPARVLQTLGGRLHEVIRRFGVPVSAEEFETIDRFHDAFVREGLALQFQTFGRATQSYNPTYRELLLETDAQGRKRSYVASEEAFQFVRVLQGRDGVIPVVGDFAGNHALAAIGKWMAARNEYLSAFYVSNVENYLFRSGAFKLYVENLRRLPHGGRSVVIRSIFAPYRAPESVPGYHTTSIVQSFDELLRNAAAGRYPTYAALLRR